MTTKPRGRIGRWWWAVGLAIAALVVVILAPACVARSRRAGAGRRGPGVHRAGENFVSGLPGDYAIPGIDNEWLSTVLAGLIGVAIVFALMWACGRLLARRRVQA